MRTFIGSRVARASKLVPEKSHLKTMAKKSAQRISLGRDGRRGHLDALASFAPLVVLTSKPSKDITIAENGTACAWDTAFPQQTPLIIRGSNLFF